MFYRLAKPDWAKEKNRKGEPNPDFLRSIKGPNVIEGMDFSVAYLKEQNDLGYNVWWFPNHPSTNVYTEEIKHLNGKLIDQFNFVFVDMDLKDGIYPSKEAFYAKLKEFELEPIYVVDSGNGVHAYWRITDLDRNKYVLTQVALLNHFKTDPSVFTTMQLMRVWNLNNTKDPNNIKPVRTVEGFSYGEAAYVFADIPEYLFDLPKDQLEKAQTHLDRLDGKKNFNFSHDIDYDTLPERFYNFLISSNVANELFYTPESYGDRSGADMVLANLLFKENFEYKEVVAIISNSQKALSKGPYRETYATTTVDKAFSRSKLVIETASSYKKKKEGQIEELPIKGPYYLDQGVLGNIWRRKELLGVIAGSGVGKTDLALNIIRDTILNNMDNDDLYIFFSLEMTKGQVFKRWVELTEGDPQDVVDRFVVTDTVDDNGQFTSWGLQEIYNYCKDVKRVTGKHVASIVVDHIHIIGRKIDLSIKPTFDAEVGVIGNRRFASLEGDDVVKKLATLVQMLDTFGIILTQTTKDKGVGDLPIGKEGAHGMSGYEWFMHRIISVWQPLMRVQEMSPIKFTAYQYAKLREKHPDDKVAQLQHKLLTFNPINSRLTPTTPSEYETFSEVLPMAHEARRIAMGKEAGAYTI